jgi:hypothetical protein
VSAAPPHERSPGAVWRVARAWLPWLVAAGILAGLAARLPRAEIAHAMRAGPFWTVGLWSVAMVAATLVADAWATRVAFAATGVRCPWRDLLLARGATYLLGLLNSVAGQGGMGVYLNRAGVGPLRAVGTVLLLIGSQVAALGTVAAVGMAADAASGDGSSLAWSLPLLGALAAAFALYLGLVAWRPARLARREILAPLFATGLRGFLRVTAARLPQTLVMILGFWLGLRLWGIALPFGRGLMVLSVVVLATVPPVAPSGIGTMELAVVALAAPAAPAATAATSAPSDHGPASAAAAATAATTAATATTATTAASAAAKANVLACTLVYHLGSIVAQGFGGFLCLALLPRRRAGGGCEVEPLPGLAAAAPGRGRG